jgi:S1-C subfamily serine protease
MSTSSHDTLNTLAALSDAMAAAVAKAGAATVLVNARRRLPASGIGYAPDRVLTANHVVERDDDITIMLPDGSEIPASVAGRDPGNDLALLRLSRSGVVVADLASDEPRVGQIVLALGRPTPEGIQASLGVLSAMGGPVRTGHGGLLERYLRTDATPYPGFSGGPLIDATGKVVGINTSGLAWGAPLAIPGALAWQVAEALAQHGHLRRGYLGVRSQPVELSSAQQRALGRSQASGLLLVGVETDSPAERGGLMVSDILVAIAGKPVPDADELLSRLTGEIVGRATPLEILRGGQPQTITVTIGERAS